MEEEKGMAGEDTAAKKPPKHRRPWWSRLLIATAWTAGGIVALVALLLGAVVWILTPERLTPLVEQVAAPYIDGRLTVGRVELTVWRTFPHGRVDIDSLSVISNGLRGVDLAGTGIENADSLLEVEHMHGVVNLAALLTGKIRITDVEVRRPMVNAVALNDSTSNFNILRLPSDTTESGPTLIPDISLGQFHIVEPRQLSARLGDMSLVLHDARTTDGGGLMITGLRDSTATVRDTTLVGVAAAFDGYRLSLGRWTMSYGDRDVAIDSLTLATDGMVAWSPRHPLVVGFREFTATVNGVSARLSADIDLSEDMVIDRASVELPKTPVEALIAAVPPALLPKDMPQIRTTARLSAMAALTSPYRPGKDALPDVKAELRLHDGDLHVGHDMHIDNLALDLTATIDGKRPDRSTVTLRRLAYRRLGTDFTLTGHATRLMSNPRIEGHFQGRVDFNRLPPRLRPLIPGDIAGRLSADSEFAFSLADVMKSRLNRVRLTGHVELRDFAYTTADSVPTRFYTRDARLRLGANDAITLPGGHRADSLLTASLQVDTMSVGYDGMDIAMRGLHAGVGCLNTAASFDTTQVTPMGGSFRFERMDMTAPDSVKIRLRDISARAVLRRHEGNGKLPELTLGMKARRIRYIDRLNRLTLREGDFDLHAFIKPRASDSARMARRRRNADVRAAIDSSTVGMEKIDMRLDRPMRRLLRRLDMQGTLTATRGRLMTPYFPLRNRIENFNMRFTTDSVTFRDVKYTAGKSDFTISGTISNISRFLTSKRNADLKIRLRSRSGMIDVNQLSLAVFSGAAFAEKEATTAHDFSAIEDDGDLEAVVEATASDTVSAAFIVPYNIDASMRVAADTILYTDLALNDFKGSVLMRDGAVNLRRLQARTNVGRAELTALYSAPTKKDVRFGFGMQLSDVDLKEAIGLIPQVDSLMPLLRDFAGTVNADVAATADLDSAMNFQMPTLNAAIKLSGDSLVLMDGETFRTLGKWLFFKQKDRNMIDHMEAEMVVRNSMLELFPFVFDIDRYRLGVMGYNDLALNLNYHISVLKSPLPFKFGINIGGNADKMKIRVGKARYKEGMASTSVAVVDTTRINLLNEIERVFRRGARSARLGGLNVRGTGRQSYDVSSDTISHADSLALIKQGVLDAPPVPPEPAATDKKRNKNNKKR